MNSTQAASPATCMVIAFALIMGVVTFAAVAGVALNQPAPVVEQPFISIGAAGMGAMMFVLSFFVPGMVGSQNLQALKNRGYPVTEAELLQVYQLKLIIRYALLEGGAFLNLIAFMVEHQTWSLGIVGVIVGVMILLFPTPGRIHYWIKEQKELLELEI